MIRVASVSFARRPRASLATLMVASLFIAAPTPGNVGGCSGRASSTPIDAAALPPGIDGAVPGAMAPTAEYAFFDRGLCASFCLRLRECGTLCIAMGQPAGCVNDSTDAYVMCMRGRYEPVGCNPASDAGPCTLVGGLDPRFFEGETRCPHSCAGPERRPGPAVYSLAYEWDVQACGDAVAQTACADITRVISAPPRECTNVCREPGR